MMNFYVQTQIENMRAMVKTFEAACASACLKDDNQVSRSEKKIMKKLKAANEDYLHALEKILKY